MEGDQVVTWHGHGEGLADRTIAGSGALDVGGLGAFRGVDRIPGATIAGDAGGISECPTAAGRVAGETATFLDGCLETVVGEEVERCRHPFASVARARRVSQVGAVFLVCFVVPDEATLWSGIAGIPVGLNLGVCERTIPETQLILLALPDGVGRRVTLAPVIVGAGQIVEFRHRGVGALRLAIEIQGSGGAAEDGGDMVPGVTE